MKNDLREKLAELCHEKWVGWMEYLFSKCYQQQHTFRHIPFYTGDLTIPKELVDRWQRQMQTPYSELSEEEKESDRKEADKFIAIISDKTKFFYELFTLMVKYNSANCLEANSDLSELSIDCNDFFMWGCSDSEDITIETLPILKQAFQDAPDDGALLYCARQRKMRPQGACYKWLDKKNWPLFDQCGVVRPAEFGNPQERPSN